MTVRAVRFFDTITPTTRVLLALLGLAACFAIDMPVHRYTAERTFNFDKLDFAQFLRTGGYIPLWFVVAGALGLEDCRRAGRLAWRAASRGVALAAALVFAGLLAEALKVVFRRERITESHQWYAVRPFRVHPLTFGSFDTGGLAMPSSHAMIAFTAAFVLGRFFPGARPALLLFAIGTAAGRVYSNAHLPSDVYVSMLVAWSVARAFAPHAIAPALPAPPRAAASVDAPAT